MNSTIARASNTLPKSLVILIIPVINAVMVRLYHNKNLEQQLSNSGSSSNLNWDQPKQKKSLSLVHNFIQQSSDSDSAEV